MKFDNVRTGEPKIQKMKLKNIGMYPVKFGFNMKKKSTWENFTITPTEGELNPNEEKEAIVTF